MSEEIDNVTKAAIEGMIADIANIARMSEDNAIHLLFLYLIGKDNMIPDRIRFYIKEHIESLARDIDRSVDETKYIVLKYLASKVLESRFAASRPVSESKVSDVVDKYRTELYNLYTAARSCIEENTSILDLLPWSRHLVDTMNIWLSFHRSNILGDLVRKIPETTRSRALPSMLSARFEVTPFSYVSRDCMESIIRFMSEASRIVLVSATKVGVNRYVVGAARIISILSRAASKDGFYIDRKSLIGLLYELYINVSALI